MYIRTSSFASTLRVSSIRIFILINTIYNNGKTPLFTVYDATVYVVGQADVVERDGRPGGSPGVPVRLLSDGALLIRALHHRIRVLRAHPTAHRPGNHQRGACRSV